MAAFSCLHCGLSNNMHHEIYKSCYRCGLPVLNRIKVIKEILHNQKDFCQIPGCELRDYAIGGTQYTKLYLKNAMFSNGEPMKNNGSQLFLNDKKQIYVVYERYCEVITPIFI